MKTQTTKAGHAVVIGGSIAGTLTARVLADLYESVTIVERDRLPEAAAHRSGVPHARHAHGLLVRGELIMEEFFPGFAQGLLDAGAVRCNMGNESVLYFGGKRIPSFASALDPIMGTRALIERQLRRKLQEHANVRILQQHSVEAISTNQDRTHVKGLYLRNRSQQPPTVEWLEADLIVDASGRNSELPQWLEGLGFTPPEEVTVNANVGYTSRIYRRPTHAPEWKIIYYLPEAPQQSRGAILIPVEAEADGEPRWILTLTGLNGDHPPTDEAGFLNFVRSLPTPELYNAIADAEPLSAPFGYRRTENRLRKYDQLPRYLEGLLAVGDSVYALNPVYAQGMTVASLGAKTLQKVLRTHRQRHGTDVTGLAQRFQIELGKVLAAPWQLATGQDLRWPAAAAGHHTPRIERLVQRYLDAVISTMGHDTTVAEAFFHVQNMLKPPTSLFHPAIAYRVWKQSRRNTGEQPAIRWTAQTEA